MPQVILPQRVDIVPNLLLPEAIVLVSSVPEGLVDASHRSLAKPRLKPVEEVGRLLVPLIPLVGDGVPLPVFGAEVRPQPDPVGDALDQAAGARPAAVVLEAVDQLMDQHAVDLVGAGDVALGALWRRLDMLDVVEGEIYKVGQPCAPMSQRRMASRPAAYELNIRISLWSSSRSDPLV